MKLKILPLESWMTWFKEFPDSGPELEQIAPIFNRNGYYLQQGFCWFEFNGEAYKYKRESFLYNLQLYNHKPLRKAEQDAIRTLGKLAPKSLRQLLQLDSDWNMIRDTYRMTMKGLTVRKRKWLKKK